MQTAAPVTLALLPSFPERKVDSLTPDEVFEVELRRRFENLPSFLKGDGCGFNLATAVILLSKPNPKIELLEREVEQRPVM